VTFDTFLSSPSDCLSTSVPFRLIGRYHERYGDVPQEELLRVVRLETLGEGGKRLLLHGMQNLVSALAEVMGVAEGGGEEVRH
jgi:hypothetical protein